MTSTETGSSWSERLSPRNWSLPWKLVAVGLVPALLAIVLGVLRVSDQAHTASELGAANRVLAVRGQVADAATALRIERDRATTFLAQRREGDRGPLLQAVRDTDSALDRFRSGSPASADLDQATRTAFEQAQGGFAQLSVLRGQVDGTGPVLPADIMQSYSGVVARADVLDRALLREASIPDVGGLADALTAATAASEAVALQHTVLGAALRSGSVSPADRAVLNATDNSFVAAYTEYQVALPPTQAPVNFITSRANAQRDADKATILSAPNQGPISLTTDRWDADSQAAADRVNAATGGAASALTDAGNAAEARSSNLAGLNSVLLMLGVLVAATIVVLMSRSLTRSLRILRTSALEIAGRRLPQAVEAIRSGTSSDISIEPVPLHTRDEIGEVARAFDEVHDQALRLAADQAALQASVSNMFVNLSRRSQGLVERQLQLIEQLESNEQDPDQLSNLFQLDHLATRMRRNSENLLVLAGTDFAKRNVAPVPLVDVLRAAVSEIEHYQRVVVQAPPQATMVGRSTSDIVHLLAELLDNATSFSPPDSQVIISSHRTADGSILVEIADRGVGMPEHELSDANRRLSTPSAVDVSASRRMGLYVVGRLGTRHGITVHLGGASLGAPGGGLTASVTLPAHLVVSAGESGGRPPRPDGALAAQGNGVPPQRAGYLGRPAPRATLAAPGNGQAFAHSGGLNGLPTRTPGSSLRREPTPVATADPAPRERSSTASESAAEQAAPLALPAQPAARLTDTDGRDHDTSDTGGFTPNTDATPTGAVPTTGTAADRADGWRTDDAADTPPSGRSGDGRPGDGRAPRSAWSIPARGPRPTGSTAPGTAGVAGSDDAQDGSPNGTVPTGAVPTGATANGSAPTRPGPGPNGLGTTARPGSKGPGSNGPGSNGPGSNGPGSKGPDANSTGSNGAVPNSSVPNGSTRQNPAPQNPAPQNPAPQNPAPRSSAPTSSAPTSSAPTGSAPPAAAPKSSAPTSSAPADAEPIGTAPKNSAPERSDRGSATDAADGAGAAAGAAAAAAAADTGLPRRRPVPRPAAAERGRPESESTPSSTGAAPTGPAGAETDDTASERSGATPAAAAATTGDTGAGTRQNTSQNTSRNTPRDDTADDAATDTGALGRPGSPRPRPTPGPNGTYRDLAVPSTPYGAFDEAAQNGTTSQNGPGRNGAAQYGDTQYGDTQYGDTQHGDTQHGADRAGGPSPRGTHPHTTPLPVVPGTEAPTGPHAFGVSGVPDDGADALFSARVPAISDDDDDALSRARRPLGELRRGPADIVETTPIFEEIASAWFASQRPVPVDWELGQRPGGDTAEVTEHADAVSVPDRPRPSLPSDRADPLAPSPVSPAPSQAAPLAPTPSAPVPASPAVSSAQAFASAADEGWRAASGAATERPDELTAAGLPKRRPRARLVPGSAGSAVLAAPASPTRSAESVRGRLASYQQGVRQGREIRLRRDPGGAGSEPDTAGENASASAGGEHDEDNR